MPKIKIDELLETIVRQLILEFQPEEIILFGSHAWGRPHRDSDLDIMVIVSDSDLSPAKRAARAHYALRGISFPIDILVKTRSEFEKWIPVKSSLERQVAERGRVLYGRNKTRVSESMAHQGNS